MEYLTQFPLLIFAVAFMALWLASVIGSWLRRRKPGAEGKHVEDGLSIILSATLTLLGLIIGFSISMASSRYDQRKNLEEAEANAIGTEMLRAGLLSSVDASNVRALLSTYLNQRILFYINRDDSQQTRIDQSTSRLQAALWEAVRGPASGEPSPVMALALAGMNDVINSQGYAQAASWNRLPAGVWWLMVTVALCSNMLFGFRFSDGKVTSKLTFVLPFVIALAFLLIADIDTPKHGIIRVHPQNLEALMKSPAR
jgi:hypothetical protein